MLLRTLLAATVSVGLMTLGADAGWGQVPVADPGYPVKPIRIISTGAGGNSNFSARLIAQALSGPLGRQVIVDNRGAGVIPGAIVSKAAPDGYTLLFYGSPLWLAPFMQNDVPYDPVADFSPISWVSMSPNILVVHPSLPVKNVKELIALAKARPGRLNYASSGAGSSAHIAAELFKSMAVVDIVRINYKASALAIADVVGGQVELEFASPSQAWSHVKSGRLRALGITSAQPSDLTPGIPTIAATGVPGYEATGMTGIFAPAKTPASIVNRLNQEVVRALRTAEMKEAFLNNGVEAIGSTPEQFAAAIKNSMNRIGKLIKDLGIRGE